MTEPSTKQRKERCSWRDADDATLINTLRTNKAAFQTDSGWKPQVWPICAAALAASPGATKTAAKCQDHYGGLKALFNEARKLRGASGFGWDDGLKTVTATDDVWTDYIVNKKNAWATKWQKKPFPLYDDIMFLVDGIVATGEGAFHAGTTPTPSTNDPVIPSTSTGTDAGSNNPSAPGTPSSPSQTVPHTPAPPIRMPAYNDATPSSPFTEPASSRKRAASSSPQKPGRKSRARNADATNSMASAMLEIAGALKVKGSPEILARAVQVMEEDDELSDNESVEAMKLFMNNSKAAQLYIAPKTKALRTKFVQGLIESTLFAP